MARTQEDWSRILFQFLVHFSKSWESMSVSQSVYIRMLGNAIEERVIMELVAGVLVLVAAGKRAGGRAKLRGKRERETE